MIAAVDADIGPEFQVVIGLKPRHVGAHAVRQARVSPVAALPSAEIIETRGRRVRNRRHLLVDQAKQRLREAEARKVEPLRDASLRKVLAGDAVTDVDHHFRVEHVDVVEREAAVDPVQDDRAVITEPVVLVLLPPVVMDPREQTVVFTENMVHANEVDVVILGRTQIVEIVVAAVACRPPHLAAGTSPAASARPGRADWWE